MSVHTGTFDMAERAAVSVACPSCKWTNEGRLVLVDRYLTDWPPGPRGDGHSFLELYLDSTCDPDDRVNECPSCTEYLDSSTVVERS